MPRLGSGRDFAVLLGQSDASVTFAVTEAEALAARRSGLLYSGAGYTAPARPHRLSRHTGDTASTAHDKVPGPQPARRQDSAFMLSFFRNMAKSKIVWIVLFVPVGAGLLTIGSVRQDLSGLFSPKDAVILAGGRTFTSDDFKHDFDAYRRQATQQGQQLTADDAVAAGVDQQMLQALAQRESLSATLTKLGIQPSAQQVFDEGISKVKAFQDPVSGKFDKKAYIEVLNQNQLTPAYFEKEQRDQLAYTQFAYLPPAAGLMPPRLCKAPSGRRL